VAQNISQDSIEEYQVSRATWDVTTGLSGSGAVNIATRSGSNDLHGTAFFFWRDHTLAARLGSSDAPFDREQGGFRIGGPIRRESLFWFASYERNHQDAVVVTHIPGFSQFDGTWPFPFDERMANARIDWNIKPNARAFARFTHNWNRLITPNTFGGGNLSPLLNTSQANQTALGIDLARGRMMHSVRFGYLNYHNYYATDQYGVPGLPRTLDPVGRPISVRFSDGSLVGPYTNGPGRRFHHTREFRYDGGWSVGRHSVRWGVDLNLIRVNWFESVGSNAPIIGINSNNLSSSDPLSYPVTSANMGNGLGFYTEKPCLEQRYGCIPNNRVHWYTADSWRATPRLTVNYAVRWVYEPGQDNRTLQKPAFYDSFQAGRSAPDRSDRNNFAPQLGLAWSPTASGKWVIRSGAGVFYDTNLLKHLIFERNQALPLGIASEFANSAGRGVRDPLTGQMIFVLNGSQDALVSSRVNWSGQPMGKVISGMTVIDAVLRASALFKQRYRAAYDQFPSGPSRCEILRNGCDTFGSNYTTPYSFQFNAGIQGELRRGLVLSVDYVRNRGLHLMSQLDQNRLGAANTLDVARATTAITATNKQFNCGPGSAGVDCVLAKPNNSVTIANYAQQGLGATLNAVQTLSNGVWTVSPNNAAFPGLNSGFNRVNNFVMGGITTYNALQVNLRGQLPNLGRGLRDVDIVASYALSRLEAAGTYEDPSFLNTGDEFFTDNPLGYRGPAAMDRTHMLTLAPRFTLLSGIRLNSIWRAFSSLPQSVFVPTAQNVAAAEIFSTDFNGDGLGGDPLPGTNRGSYGRDIGCGAKGLNRVIDAYNSTQANHLTPAGKALVGAGLFSDSQLIRLGAASPLLKDAPAGQVCLDSFITTDLRVTRPFKLYSERITVEPALEIFNLFNVANFDLADNKTGAVLNGVPGSLNGTTSSSRTNRAGFVGGSFALGTPRSWQLALRLSF
jgi:hypothetical protein